jgi:hypothetical protein
VVSFSECVLGYANDSVTGVPEDPVGREHCSEVVQGPGRAAAVGRDLTTDAGQQQHAGGRRCRAPEVHTRCRRLADRAAGMAVVSRVNHVLLGGVLVLVRVCHPHTCGDVEAVSGG